MTEQQAINKVLNLARNEIGYKEKRSNAYSDDKTANAGGGNWTKYARDLDAVTSFYNGAKNGWPWCDVFVDWLFYKSFGAAEAMQILCQPQKSAGAGCLYSAGYYRSCGRWSTTPHEGDQIFFSYSAGEVSHTGIVEQISGNKVITIEGNTSDCVARRSYTIGASSIYGYGRPRWQFATGTGQGSIEVNEDTEIHTSGGQAYVPVMDIMRLGTSGEAVRQLQENLIKLGYSCGPDGADGDYGRNTVAAVKKFQEDNGLEPDGEAGPMTQVAIRQKLQALDTKPSIPVQPTPEITPQAPAENTYTVKAGDTLWSIAAKHLGAGYKYPQIKKLNNLTSNTIKVGQVLKLP